MTDTTQKTSFQDLYGEIANSFHANETAHQTYWDECERTDRRFEAEMKRLEEKRNVTLAKAKQERQQELANADSNGKKNYAEAERRKTQREKEISEFVRISKANASSAKHALQRINLYPEQWPKPQPRSAITTYGELTESVKESAHRLLELEDLIVQYEQAKRNEQRLQKILIVIIVIGLLILAAMVAPMLFSNSAIIFGFNF